MIWCGGGFGELLIVIIMWVFLRMVGLCGNSELMWFLGFMFSRWMLKFGVGLFGVVLVVSICL